ncbi:MAG TPA: FAD-dependent oxidoreductase [Phycisphaerae bacterium]|nr:FAD-dependent oxidoreductase [Phycisphaerae bacterium]
MRKHITEPARRVEVAGAWDVVVVGGGVAGVAAAVAAARNGARTCLVEKQCALGGLATLGNVAVYLPLCDGMGRQVIGGLGEELLKLSVRDGFDPIPAAWRKGGRKSDRLRQRYAVTFNPPSFLLELERLVLGAGVTVFYDSRFCDVVSKRNRIDAVVIENKSGRLALLARTVVDASGDADVCARAGEETVSLRTNVRCGWFYYFDGDRVRIDLLSQGFHPDGKRLRGTGPWYAGDNGADVSAQIIASRKLARRRLAELRKSAASRAVYPVSLPTIATHRMTRRLKGAVELEQTDDRRYFADAVGMTGDWRQSGPIFFFPLRSLLGLRTRNLAAAGRCISAGSTAWDVTRAIPTCAVTGEAAGTAAALACRTAGGAMAALDVAGLQDRLRKQGVLIEPRLARA